MKNLKFFSAILLLSCLVHDAHGADACIAAMRRADRTIQEIQKCFNDFKAAGEDINVLWPYVIQTHNRPIIELFLKEGASINARLNDARLELEQSTPLIFAAKNIFPYTVKKFLEFGADPSLKDASGNTALMYAAENGQKSSVQALLDHGVDLDDVTKALKKAKAQEQEVMALRFTQSSDENMQVYRIYSDIVKMLQDYRSLFITRLAGEEHVPLFADKAGYQLPPELVSRIGQFVGPLTSEERRDYMIDSSSYAREYRALDETIQIALEAIEKIKRIPGYARDPYDIIIDDPFNRRSAAGKRIQVTIEDLQDRVPYPWKKEGVKSRLFSLSDLKKQREEIWEKILKEYEKTLRAKAEEKKRAAEQQAPAGVAASSQPQEGAGGLEDID